MRVFSVKAAATCWKQVDDERDEGQLKQYIYGPYNQNELKEAKTLHNAVWNYSFY